MPLVNIKKLILKEIREIPKKYRAKWCASGSKGKPL